MPDATLILHEKFSHGSGVVELVVWSVPQPVPPSSHGFKYRLVYVVGDVRVVGYDNERGKGITSTCARRRRFTCLRVEALLADFWRDVEGAE